MRRVALALRQGVWQMQGRCAERGRAIPAVFEEGLDAVVSMAENINSGRCWLGAFAWKQIRTAPSPRIGKGR